MNKSHKNHPIFSEEGVMKKALGILFVITLVFFGFAIAYQLGQIMGFDTGSEWAIVQADIVAREAGVFMPVYMRDGSFRVVLKQPPGVYKRAWRIADRYEETHIAQTACEETN